MLKGHHGRACIMASAASSAGLRWRSPLVTCSLSWFSNASIATLRRCYGDRNTSYVHRILEGKNPFCGSNIAFPYQGVANMATLSVFVSRELVAASKQQKQSFGLESSIPEFVLEEGRPSPLSMSNAEELAGASGENAAIASSANTLRKVEAVYTRRSRRSSTTQVTTTEEVSKDGSNISIATAEILSSREETVKMSSTGSAKFSRRKKVVGKLKQGSDCTDILGASAEEEIEKETATLDKVSKTSVATCEDASVQGDKASKKSSRYSRKRKSDAIPCQQSEVETAVTIETEEREVLVKTRDPWLLLVHKKVQSDWSVYNPVTMRRSNLSSSSVKIVSWNVNGLRALLKGKGAQKARSAILQLVQREDFDIVCLQETKLQEKDVPTIKEAILPGYDNSFWSCSTAKLGYSGTAIISRIAPLSVSYGLGVSNHDKEGRIITLEFDKFFLVTGYIPNSGQKLERLAYRTQEWDASLASFLKDLEQQKPVILTGDLNCAHQEIDIYNPDGNRRSAGFTDEERASFEKNFLEKGLIDTFRRHHPNVVGYTYWGYRTAARPKNQGWRLDYFLASEALVEHIHDSYILPDVDGSDHCPIGLILNA